jgi:glycosyltransferase involved in cell wall biosynthesis
MVQDYEPLFYPAGTTYGQAELSYRFGFYGIANTISLRDIYARDFRNKATTLTPCIDTRIFFPGNSLRTDERLRLFYYARPGTPRNGFELAVTALKLVKERLGEKVEILCAGSHWNPEDYGLAGLINSIGMLPYESTGDLYRSCHVGLALMFTKHPSYLPFEMMACGTMVVANHNTANTWLLKDRENCLLAYPAASCLATTLIEALLDYDSLSSIRQSASQLILNQHSDWHSSLSDVAQFMHSPN